MKTIHLLMVLAFVSLQLTPCSAQTNESDNATTNQISIGVRDGLYSEILKEQRELLIHVPSSAGYGRRFPVLFVLDGEYHFESVVGIMKYHSLSGLIPEMIVVAIPNTDRFRDLTTSHIGDDTNPSGGAGNFTKFLESELIPYIDKTYPTFPHRTLFGHSLGGLVVVNTLLNHKHLFNNYLAIDPSLSWGDQSFLKEAKSKIQERVYEDKSLYIAIANTLRGDMTVEEARQDTTTATLHLRSIFEFSELAKANEQLLSDSKYYGSEIHGTLPIIAEQDAFRFLFSWYQFEHWGEFYSPAPKFSGEELRDMVVSYYEKLSDKFGQQLIPWEDEINGIVYLFLGRKDYDRAFPFLEWNIQNYPESANVYDSMGDYYVGVSDDANAIKYFSKSLELGGVDGTKEKLEALQRKK